MSEERRRGVVSHNMQEHTIVVCVTFYFVYFFAHTLNGKKKQARVFLLFYPRTQSEKRVVINREGVRYTDSSTFSSGALFLCMAEGQKEGRCNFCYFQV